MKHILVVDDFNANVIMVQKALAGKYEVSTATSGENALVFLKNKIPDLIILDIQMPEMTGLQVLENIRREPKTKDIPVIFLTTQADRDNITKGFSLGVTDVIAKPIIMRNIENRIQAAFEKIRKKQEEKVKETIKGNGQTKSSKTEQMDDFLMDDFLMKDFLMSEDWKDVF